MKELFLTISILLLLNGCSNKRTYQFIESRDGVTSNKTIVTDNDSLAFMDALERYFIAKKLSLDLSLTYELINPEGLNITEGYFLKNPEEIRSKIELNIFSDSTIVTLNKSGIEKVASSDDNRPEWQYSEQTNEMDDSVSYFAYLIANEKLHFGFPYTGETSVTLIIRKMSSGTDVMLKISQGQFLSSYNNNIEVRFDSNKAEKFSFIEPLDHSSTTIFIRNNKKIISNLKKSETLIFDVGFFRKDRKSLNLIQKVSSGNIK